MCCVRVANPCATEAVAQTDQQEDSTDCANTASGVTCTVGCNSGYTGSQAYVCTAGSWDTTTAVTCVGKLTTCVNLIPIQLESEFLTQNAHSYRTAEAQLVTGAEPVAANRKYAERPLLSKICCVRVADPCASAPATQTDPEEDGTNCSGTASGVTCTVGCNSGYTGSQDYVCTTGSWDTATPVSCAGKLPTCVNVVPIK